MSELLKKWAPVLEHEGVAEIKDAHKKAVVAKLLENQEIAQIEASGEALTESADVTQTNAPVAKYDPVLISLVRRSMPNLVAFDLVGVQPMSGPTGLVFAIRSKYADNADLTLATEALHDEANSAYTGAGAQTGTDPSVLNAATPGPYTGGTGMGTGVAEQLGTDSGTAFPEMGFEIEKISVTAKSRALKAHYSVELAQDLKNLHGLSAESELANILSTELLAEMNREIVRTIYTVAVPGAQNADLTTAGIYDLDTDNSGRWFAEKFAGLKFQIEREMNAIAKTTRRGKGNILVCSSDVASALNMGGSLVLDNNQSLLVDDTGNTFVGMMGRVKVFIDPYATGNWFVAGYKGTNSYDSGLFYCPYVPLTMYKAVGEDSFQPRIGFKTRYGMVANPFAEGANKGGGALNANANLYYRRVAVTNLSS